MTIRPYPFGFLVSNKPIENQELIQSNFRRFEAWDGIEVYIQPDEPTQLVQDDNLKLLWFGHAAFVGDTSIELPFIERARQELSKGWHAFHSFLDYVVGRWAALIVKDEKTKLYNDTLASQPVYIAREEALLFGSHLPLINEELNARTGITKELVSLGQHKLWDQTEDTRIAALPPNFCFEFETKELNRFYPHPYTSIDEFSSINTAVEQAIALAKRSVQHWGSLDYKAYCALTAGMDTRVCASAALASGIDFSFVTYGSTEPPSEEDGNTKRSYKLDIRVSRLIAETFKKEHVILPMEDVKSYPLSAEDKATLQRNTVGKHALNFQGLYENTLGTHPSICFVGTALEAFRDYYSPAAKPTTSFETFTRIVSALGGYSSKSDDEKLTTELAYELWERYNMKTVLEHGFPVANILYQELRAGRFQSEAINCQASAFLPINPIAIRKLFETAQSLPFYDRKNAVFAKSFIQKACPTLTQFPINDKDFSIAKTNFVDVEAVFSRTTEDEPYERYEQTPPDIIQLKPENLHKGGERFFRKRFSAQTGSLRLTFHNHYNIGRDANNVVIFIRINDNDVYRLPIGKRNDPCTVAVDGLRYGDSVDIGVRSMRENGLAWSNVSLLKLTEWTETPIDFDSSQPLEISSTREFRVAE
ncbi:hypothetical protein [Corynebacterium sp. HMSC036D02]|uniref:hypothetical protein n=1 Tax=Corynebacterium sp. HMSC036D02 TaxID=1715013 RepID=UPI0008A9D030|nr:hypothetical protein [Corynebacterium sp. HMSC036D02]OHO63830.1 hypothetical protein HMPREF2743_00100 [Corynebacterium sp. HMSC036D02]